MIFRRTPALRMAPPAATPVVHVLRNASSHLFATTVKGTASHVLGFTRNTPCAEMAHMLLKHRIDCEVLEDDEEAVDTKCQLNIRFRQATDQPNVVGGAMARSQFGWLPYMYNIGIILVEDDFRKNGDLWVSRGKLVRPNVSIDVARSLLVHRSRLQL